MPPQAGYFPLPYNNQRSNTTEPPAKRRRRSERDILQAREDLTSLYAATIQRCKDEALALTRDPYNSPGFALRLYPLSVERVTRLSQARYEEGYAIECAMVAHDEENRIVEEEYQKGKDRIRARLLEGIEERRRKAREEKDGEGITDATLDSQARSHVTRKLRNQMNISPPPTPPGSNQAPALNPTTVTLTNPNSLSIDELPSPFPLPLTSSAASASYSTGGNGRRKAKGGGGQQHAMGGLGKAILLLTGGKETEIESDLGEIRRGTKRRRLAATGK